MTLAAIDTRYVYDFAEEPPGGRELLGGKGLGLSEMTRLGLPVPRGFTVTTDACRAYLEADVFPEGLDQELGAALQRLERATGTRFGSSDRPLLVSVRSGAHRHEQRPVARPEPGSGCALEALQCGPELLVEPLGEDVGLQIRAARVRRDREAAWNGQPESRHLGKAEALAAEELSAAGWFLCEVVDVAGVDCREGHRRHLSLSRSARGTVRPPDARDGGGRCGRGARPAGSAESASAARRRPEPRDSAAPLRAPAR